MLTVDCRSSAPGSFENHASRVVRNEYARAAERGGGTRGRPWVCPPCVGPEPRGARHGERKCSSGEKPDMPTTADKTIRHPAPPPTETCAPLLRCRRLSCAPLLRCKRLPPPPPPLQCWCGGPETPRSFAQHCGPPEATLNGGRGGNTGVARGGEGCRIVLSAVV